MTNKIKIKRVTDEEGTVTYHGDFDRVVVTGWAGHSPYRGCRDPKPDMKFHYGRLPGSGDRLPEAWENRIYGYMVYFTATYEGVRAAGQMRGSASVHEDVHIRYWHPLSWADKTGWYSRENPPFRYRFYKQGRKVAELEVGV